MGASDPVEPLKKSAALRDLIVGLLEKGANKKTLAGLILVFFGFLHLYFPSLHYPYWIAVALALILFGIIFIVLGWERELKPAQLAILKGPSPFGIAEGKVFLRLGRESEIADLVSWIRSERTGVVLLWGPPASGKTSLVDSGLRQALADHAPRDLFYGDANQEDFAKSLSTAIKAGSPPTPPGEELRDIVAADRQTTQVVVIDNAERARDRNFLIDLFRAAVEAPPPYKRILVAIMSDREFNDHWFGLQWPRSGECLKSLEVARFSQGTAAAVISTIMEVASLPISGRLIEEITRDIQINEGEKEVISPLTLSIVLQLIGRAGIGGHVFDLKEYHESGRAAGLMAGFLAKQLTSLLPGVWRQTVAAIKKQAAADAHEFRAESLILPAAAASRRLPVLERLCSAEVRVLRQNRDGTVFRILNEWLPVLESIRRGEETLRVTRIEETVRNKLFIWQQSRPLYTNRKYLGSILEGRYLLSWFNLFSLHRNRRRLDFSGSPSIVRYVERSRHHRRWRLAVQCGFLLIVAGVVGVIYQESQTRAAERMAMAWQLPVDIFSQYGDQLSALSFAVNLNDLKWLPRGLGSLGVHCNGLYSLKGIPKNLRRLSISRTGIRDLAGLPFGLEELDISGTSIRGLSGLKGNRLAVLDLSGMRLVNMRAIPRSVRKLKLQSPLIASLEGLPDLTELELRGTAVESLSSLPRSLTKLTLAENAKLKGLDYDLPALTILETDKYTGNLGSPHLKTLKLVNRPLVEVPGSLEKLELANSAVEGDLPDLEELRLDDKKSAVSVNELPGNLLKLKLQWPAGAQFGSLPAQLQELDISYSEGLRSLRGISRTLRRLDISRTAVVDLRDVPDSVVDLAFKWCDSVRLKRFPKRLQSVNLAQCSRLESIDNLPDGVRFLNVSKTLLISMPKLSNKLRSLDISNTCIREHLPSLPDGLKELSLHVSQLKTLKGLPKSVRTLHFVEYVEKSPPRMCPP